MRGWLEMCMYEMDVAMLFLMLASDVMIAMDCKEEALITIESS